MVLGARGACPPGSATDPWAPPTRRAPRPPRAGGRNGARSPSASGSRSAGGGGAPSLPGLALAFGSLVFEKSRLRSYSASDRLLPPDARLDFAIRPPLELRDRLGERAAQAVQVGDRVGVREAEGELAAERDHRDSERVPIGRFGESRTARPRGRGSPRAVSAQGHSRRRGRTPAGPRSTWSPRGRAAGSGRAREERVGSVRIVLELPLRVSALITRRRVSGSGSASGRSTFRNESRLPSSPFSSSRA